MLLSIMPSTGAIVFLEKQLCFNFSCSYIFTLTQQLQYKIVLESQDPDPEYFITCAPNQESVICPQLYIINVSTYKQVCNYVSLFVRQPYTYSNSRSLQYKALQLGTYSNQVASYTYYNDSQLCLCTISTTIIARSQLTYGDYHASWALCPFCLYLFAVVLVCQSCYY